MENLRLPYELPCTVIIVSPSNPHAVVLAAASHFSGLYDVVAFCMFRNWLVFRDWIVPPMVNWWCQSQYSFKGIMRREITGGGSLRRRWLPGLEQGWRAIWKRPGGTSGRLGRGRRGFCQWLLLLWKRRGGRRAQSSGGGRGAARNG
jgi:hypothetical protein